MSGSPGGRRLIPGAAHQRAVEIVADRRGGSGDPLTSAHIAIHHDIA